MDGLLAVLAAAVAETKHPSSSCFLEAFPGGAKKADRDWNAALGTENATSQRRISSPSRPGYATANTRCQTWRTDDPGGQTNLCSAGRDDTQERSRSWGSPGLAEAESRTHPSLRLSSRQAIASACGGSADPDTSASQNGRTRCRRRQRRAATRDACRSRPQASEPRESARPC